MASSLFLLTQGSLEFTATATGMQTRSVLRVGEDGGRTKEGGSTREGGSSQEAHRRGGGGRKEAERGGSSKEVDRGVSSKDAGGSKEERWACFGFEGLVGNRTCR